MDLRPGSKVRLVTPDNPRLHGAAGEVLALTAWGAHVRTPAAGSGRFRALSAEMVPDGGNGGGYSGYVCDTCGSARMRRNGTCLLCDDCGSTTGCS